MRKAGGCPRYLDFHDCGCVCPYMHARSSNLGRWFTAQARDNRKSLPHPWHCDIALKDERSGGLRIKGLPYIDGFCVGPKEWRILNPSHVKPRKVRSSKVQKQNSTITINAFNVKTLKAVHVVRNQVKEAFDKMQMFW